MPNFGYHTLLTPAASMTGKRVLIKACAGMVALSTVSYHSAVKNRPGNKSMCVHPTAGVRQKSRGAEPSKLVFCAEDVQLRCRETFQHRLDRQCSHVRRCPGVYLKDVCAQDVHAHDPCDRANRRYGHLISLRTPQFILLPRLNISLMFLTSVPNIYSIPSRYLYL